jgi:hypothetical protein
MLLVNPVKSTTLHQHLHSFRRYMRKSFSINKGYQNVDAGLGNKYILIPPTEQGIYFFLLSIIIKNIEKTGIEPFRICDFVGTQEYASGVEHKTDLSKCPIDQPHHVCC